MIATKKASRCWRGAFGGFGGGSVCTRHEMSASILLDITKSRLNNTTDLQNFQRLQTRAYGTCKLNEEFDVVIIGGGMVGAALGCGLAKNALTSSLRVAIIDSNAINGASHSTSRDEIPDSRVSAITPATVDFLKEIGAWKGIQNCRHAAFESMQVWDYTGLGYTRYNAADAAKSELGYVVENKVLLAAMYSCLRESSFVTLLCPAHVKAVRTAEQLLSIVGSEEWGREIQRNNETAPASSPKEAETQGQDAEAGLGLAQVELDDGRCLLTRLVVGADGARSKVRMMVGLKALSWEYKQLAVICTVETAMQHSTAWQRFLPTGPLAVLPMGAKFSNIVWSTSPEQALKLKTMRNEDFVAAVNQALVENFGPFPSSTITRLLGDRFGSFLGGATVSSLEQFELPPQITKCLSERSSFPLFLGHAYRYASPRVVLVGDAAHTVHPLAGQGVNLGFGDAESLVNVLSEGIELGADIGEVGLLRKYERERMFANIPMMAILDGFQRVFSLDFGPVNLARAAAFKAVQLFGPLKRQVISYAMGERVSLRTKFGW